jgi:2-dehydropantoate 2-reductase
LKREDVRKRQLPLEDILARPTEERDPDVEVTEQEIEGHKGHLDQQVAMPDTSVAGGFNRDTSVAVLNPAESPLQEEPDFLDDSTPVPDFIPEVIDDQPATTEAAENISPAVGALPSTDHTLDLDTPRSPTIHILGAGRFGKYVAHSVAGLPHAPPVTLLLHTPYLMKQWSEEGAAIKILRKRKLIVQSQINVEFAGEIEAQPPGYEMYQSVVRKRRHVQHTSVIENLIVTTDGFATLPALSAVKHRLRPWSTICFLQNGMGIIDIVNDELFPDISKRPNYALGNMSHKITPTGRTFTLIEREAGNVSLSTLMRASKPRYLNQTGQQEAPLIRRLDDSWEPFLYLMRTLTRSPELRVQTLARPDFLKNQLQNLVVNAVIGPLSVLYNCPNDQLLKNYRVCLTMRLVLEEASLILRSLPEVSHMPRIHQHFSARRLELLVYSAIKRTRGNVSGMLQDIKSGKRTSIEFYNGYLVNRAMELGIPCPHNEMLLSMVKAKQTIRKETDDLYIPIRNEY